MATKFNKLKTDVEALVAEVRKKGKTDELEKQMDAMEAAINASQEEGVEETKTQELKKLLDAVK